MLGSYWILLPVFFPIVMGCLYFAVGLALKNNKAAREWFLMAVTLVTSLSMWALILWGDGQPLELFRFTRELSFVFRIDGLGKLFAGLVATLWPVTMLYAF